MIASAYKLDNLIMIVDRNQFQANKKTEDLIPLEPLDEKFESFGIATGSINGHNFTEMDMIFSQIPFEKSKPSVVIANTVRGKGIPSIEGKAERWFCNFTDPEVEQLIKELYGESEAVLTSEILNIR
jgi:transketolase